MRTKVLEIRWHETSPIFSADYQSLSPAHLKRLLGPKGKDADEAGPASSTPSKDSTTGHLIAPGRSYRLATAGADHNVRLWLIHPNIVDPSAASGPSAGPPPAPRAEFLATLKRHTAAVNVVRWSPKDDLLASAGDDGHVVLWVPKPTVPTDSNPAGAASSSYSAYNEFSGNDEGAKENWKVKIVVRVTSTEIYDLAWSPDGSHFIVGSTDNTAKVYDASTGTCIKAIVEHSHYVQGVAWDPLNEFIATQSSDRTVHVHRIVQSKGTLDFVPLSRSTKMDIHHSRTPSFSSISSASVALSLSQARPGWRRRDSAALSDTESASGASELPTGDALAGWGGSNQGPLTPSASLPGTPSLGPSEREKEKERERESGSMKPPSRRSSFTSSSAASPPPPPPPLPSAFPFLASAGSSARGRSPSPLPAIRPRTRSAALYGDEAFTHYFRRLSFSPDGALLLTPAGQIEETLLSFPASPSVEGHPPPVPSAASTTAPRPTVYIYGRANLHGAPIAHLPGQKSASVAVKFSPILHTLRTSVSGVSEGPKSIILDEKKGEVVEVKLGTGSGSASGPSSSSAATDDLIIVADAPAAASTSASLSVAHPPISSSSSSSSSSSAVPASASARLAPSPSPAPATSPSSSSSGSPAIFALPYRMYYAVATQDAVLLYDTQQTGPIAIFHGLHYAGFTDLAWSPDGQSLILSSIDGYCSVVVFDPAELGDLSPTQQHQKQLSALAQHLSAPPILAPPSITSAPSTPTLTHAAPVAPVAAAAAPPSLAAPVTDASDKRAAPEPSSPPKTDGEPAAKKKRRVAPTQIGTLD